jgi:Lipopolysaccharide-assembly
MRRISVGTAGGNGSRSRRRGRPDLWAGAAIMVASASLLTGCASLPTAPTNGASDEGGFFGWHMQAPFDTSEVKTVYVFFRSNRFRRDLQLMLMESVQKEISMRTPYRVVGDPDKADSILEGVITVDDKNLVVEAPTNLPRQLNSTMTVWINWRHNPALESERNQQPTMITESLNFVPEVGQTTLTSFQQVTENIAKQIVDMMEQPWFNLSDIQ